VHGKPHLQITPRHVGFMVNVSHFELLAWRTCEFEAALLEVGFEEDDLGASLVECSGNTISAGGLSLVHRSRFDTDDIDRRSSGGGIQRMRQRRHPRQWGIWVASTIYPGATAWENASWTPDAMAGIGIKSCGKEKKTWMQSSQEWDEIAREVEDW
jgi:hypothetical protein